MEGWVDLSTAVKVHNSCPRLYIAAAVAINTTVSGVILTRQSDGLTTRLLRPAAILHAPHATCSTCFTVYYTFINATKNKDNWNSILKIFRIVCYVYRRAKTTCTNYNEARTVIQHAECLTILQWQEVNFFYHVLSVFALLSYVQTFFR